MSGFFDPFLEMARVQRDINRLFGDANRNYLDNYCTPYKQSPLETLLDVVITDPSEVIALRRNKEGQQPQASQTPQETHTPKPTEHQDVQTQKQEQQQQHQQLQQQHHQQQQQQQQQQLATMPQWWSRSMLTPRLDVWDENNQTCVQVEVPGFAKDKLNIEVQEGVLYVSGECQQESHKEQQNLVHSERRFGSFRRAVRLPKHIKENDIQAAYNNGILTITVPHAEPPKQQKRLITITDQQPPIQAPAKTAAQAQNQTTAPASA